MKTIVVRSVLAPPHPLVASGWPQIAKSDPSRSLLCKAPSSWAVNPFRREFRSKNFQNYSELVLKSYQRPHSLHHPNHRHPLRGGNPHQPENHWCSSRVNVVTIHSPDDYHLSRWFWMKTFDYNNITAVLPYTYHQAIPYTYHLAIPYTYHLAITQVDSFPFTTTYPDEFLFLCHPARR